jgi:hypothetical protein
MVLLDGRSGRAPYAPLPPRRREVGRARARTRRRPVGVGQCGRPGRPTARPRRARYRRRPARTVIGAVEHDELGARDELRDAVRVRDVAHAVARGVPHEDLHPDVGQHRCEVLGLSACNRHLLELAARTREGIGDAGGIALEISGPFIAGDRVKTDRRAGSQPRVPGAGRGALRLSLDGLLTTGCDKTTSAYVNAARKLTPCRRLKIDPLAA